MKQFRVYNANATHYDYFDIALHICMLCFHIFMSCRYVDTIFCAVFGATICCALFDLLATSMGISPSLFCLGFWNLNKCYDIFIKASYVNNIYFRPNVYLRDLIISNIHLNNRTLELLQFLFQYKNNVSSWVKQHTRELSLATRVQLPFSNCLVAIATNMINVISRVPPDSKSVLNETFWDFK